MLAVTRVRVQLRSRTDLLPCGGVPRAHRAVWGCAEDALAVCGPLHLQHSIFVPCMVQSASFGLGIFSGIVTGRDEEQQRQPPPKLWTMAW